MTDLVVAPCDRKAAEYAVMHWHYSKAMPSGKLITFGVWENGRYIGAVIYGRGSNNNLVSPYGLTAAEGCELVRVALDKHAAPVTQIVAETLRELRATNPGLRLVVSFADPTEGHHGGIYQAGNWIYAGTATSAKVYTINGKEMHERTVGARGWKRNMDWLRANVDPNVRKEEPPPKHRYLMPLDKAMRRQVGKLRQQAPPPRA